MPPVGCILLVLPTVAGGYQHKTTTMKTLATIAVLAALLTSCEKDDTSALQTIQYEGHSFILYDGGAYAGGIIHHPDCKCRKHE